MKKSEAMASLRLALIFLFISIVCLADAQISESVSRVQFGPFTITSTHGANTNVLCVTVCKAGEVVFADSVITDISSCTGFSFPLTQPFKEYFIFSKHAKHAGLTCILNLQGGFARIGGGTFWAAPKNKLLFILAEKDYRNLVVFNLALMKTVFEKYSCDEFTNWYYLHGKYFGNVESECGDDIKSEKEVNQWIHPVEIEQFDVKLNTLNEMHLTQEQVEHAKALIKYASCQ